MSLHAWILSVGWFCLAAALPGPPALATALSPALTNPTTARHYLWLHGATWTESDHYAMRPDGHLAPLRNQ